MKKLLALIATALIVVFGGSVFAVEPEADSVATETSEQAQNNWTSFSKIDEVMIPDQVLLSIQLEHQGFAVTGAQEVKRNSLTLYRLRVDKSDIPTDTSGFYLFYTNNWWLMDRSEIDPPKKQESRPTEEPARVEQEVTEVENPVPESEETEEEPSDPEEDNDNPTEPEPPEEPEEPEEPITRPTRSPRQPRD